MRSPVGTAVDKAKTAIDKTKPLSEDTQKFVDELNKKKEDISMKQQLSSQWNTQMTWAGSTVWTVPQIPVSLPPVTQQPPKRTANLPTTQRQQQPATQPVATATQPVVTTTKPVAKTTKPVVTQPKTISGEVQKEITSQTNNETISTKPVNAINAALKAKNEAWMKAYNEAKEARIAKEQAWPVASETQLWDRAMLNMKDEESDALKLAEVSKLKETDIASNLADKERTLKAWEQALDNFRNAVGIDKDGNVDMNRKGSIWYSLQNDFNNYKSEQEKLSSQYESARKSRVASQMRANLLARWVDISKIPQEKLIALSDEVGAQAFTDIYNNKQNTLNALTAKQETLTSRLNDLRQQWILAEDKYNTLKATVESQFEKTRNDIQRSYVNDIFQITDTAKAKKEAKQTAAVNTMETMLKAVSATEAPELRSRFLSLIDKGMSSVDLVKTIANDPRFKELATSLAEQTKKEASDEATLKAQKTQAEIDRLAAQSEADKITAQASLIRANKAWAAKTSKFDAQYQTPASTTDYNAAIEAWVPANLAAQVTSKWQLLDLTRQSLTTK